jgi:anti-sigma regulatory factor (Ser/Thr protein kinase)
MVTTRELAGGDVGIWLPVHDASAAGAVRRAAVSLGEAAGLSAASLANLAIVAVEIGTNLARHAIEGRVLVRPSRAEESIGVELIAIDRGPGMADAERWTRDGNSTAGTLGIGLGAIARKSTSFDMYSLPRLGTVLAAVVGGVALRKTAGIRRPIAGEEVCGDGYGVRTVDGREQLMLCDGLGHGPLAAVAAQAAAVGFAGAPTGGPAAVMAHLNDHLRNTRGAVAGVAEIDRDAGTVRFAGIGNVAATIVDGAHRRMMVCLPGIVGQLTGDVRRTMREFDYPLPPGAAVILHSDGLTDRWDMADYPGLTARAAVVVAATLLRDAGRRRDDASVLVST